MNEVFTIREDEWQVRLGNEVLPTIWNSKGAALAGMKVEMRRRGLHVLSRDCWCQPEVVAPQDAQRLSSAGRPLGGDERPT